MGGRSAPDAASALAAIQQNKDDAASPAVPGFVAALRHVLRHPQLDAAFKDLVLTLPSKPTWPTSWTVVDPQRIHALREAMRLQLAQRCASTGNGPSMLTSTTVPIRPTPKCQRAPCLGGSVLTMLCLAPCASGDAIWPGRVYQRFKDASNMTDRFNALSALVVSGHGLAARCPGLVPQNVQA
jgi:aminopeptidase N